MMNKMFHGFDVHVFVHFLVIHNLAVRMRLFVGFDAFGNALCDSNFEQRLMFDSCVCIVNVNGRNFAGDE